jgi:hypothetical protein
MKAAPLTAPTHASCCRPTAIAMPMNTEKAKNNARTRRMGQEVFIR